MKRLFILFLLVSLALPAFVQVSTAADPGKKKDAVEIDPEQQIWLQLPMTPIPVKGGIYFVVVDVLIKAAKHATYICRIYPRLNEKIQFAFSGKLAGTDKNGVIQLQGYGDLLKPDFNEALQVNIIKRVKVFDGGKPKPPEQDVNIMECQGSAAIMAAKNSLRDLLRRQK